MIHTENTECCIWIDRLRDYCRTLSSSAHLVQYKSRCIEGGFKTYYSPEN